MRRHVSRPILLPCSSTADHTFWQETSAGETTKHAAGRLNVPGTEPFARDLAVQRSVSQGTGYHAGHLIAHQFGGPEIAANLSLQSAEMNQGGGNYYRQESRWAETLKQGEAVSVHIKEVTRAGDSAFLYRTAESITTTPTGQVSHDTVAFLNPENERVRAAENRVLNTPENAGKVLYLPQAPPPRSPFVTAQLTDDDMQHLLEAKHGQDHRAKLDDMKTILAAADTVSALDDRAQVGYDPDRELFYATLRADDKPALDERLKKMQAQTMERNQRREASRQRDSSHERD